MIDDIRKKGDSCGGEVTCIVRRCPKGLGAPVFGKLEAELAGALMSLPASKVNSAAIMLICSSHHCLLWEQHQFASSPGQADTEMADSHACSSGI